MGREANRCVILLSLSLSSFIGIGQKKGEKKLHESWVSVTTDNPNINPAITAIHNFSLYRHTSGYNYEYTSFNIATGGIVSVDQSGDNGVDFVYARGVSYNSSDTAMLVAPSAMNAMGFYSFPSNGKVSYFKKSNMSAAQFKTAGDAVLASLSVNTLSPTHLIIQHGDIVEIMTSNGKKGLMKIESRTSTDLTTSSYADFSLKVQR